MTESIGPVSHKNIKKLRAQRISRGTVVDSNRFLSSMNLRTASFTISALL